MQRPALDIKTSFIFVGLLLLIHIGAIIVLLFIDIHWYLKTLGAFACSYHFIYCLNRYALRVTQKAIVQLRCCEDDTWLLITRGGQYLSGSLNKNSVVTKTIALLTFKSEQIRNTILVPLFPGALSSTEFRALRAYLVSK
jgi:hypothetical protein